VSNLKKLLFILGILFSQIVFSQVDSIKLAKYTPGFRFNDGIYINHQQLLDNAPVTLSHIVSNYNKSAIDFYDKLLAEETIEYYDQFGIRREVKVDNLWGFCRRGSVYIKYGDDFNRIPVMGSACHFIASVTVYEDRFSSPTYGYGYYNVPTSSARTEIYQFILIFRLGKVLEYNSENVGILLMEDPELYDEFNALRKKKKNQMKFLYLRKFNEKHPLYIPIN
jgi:hypothetical protein